MKLDRILVGILIFIVLLGCKEKQSGLSFEQKVFYDIAPQIIDSLYQEVRDIHPKLIQEFSTGNPNFNEKENLPFLVVGIADSIYGLDRSQNSRFLNHFATENIHLDTSITDKKVRLEFSRIESSDIFNFERLSQIRTGPRRWKKTADFFLAGITSFSRIKFDTQQKYGFLIISSTCGRQCGVSSMVYLKELNGEWVIDEIEDFRWE